MPGGDGVDRRLAQAAGVRRCGWGVRGNRSASPVICTRIIAVGRGLRVEDDVGNLASLPLVSEQGTEFKGGAAYVEMGKADGYERAVPAPLVRIKVGSGAGPASHVVLTQDLARSRSQLFVFTRDFSRRGFHLHSVLISFHTALLGCPGYTVIVFAHPHAVLVDQLAPEVTGEPDQGRPQRGEGQGRIVRLVVLAAPEAENVAPNKGHVREAVVESHPPDRSVLYLVIVQDSGGGRARRSYQAEDQGVVGSLAQTLVVSTETGQHVERGRGRQERRRDGL